MILKPSCFSSTPKCLYRTIPPIFLALTIPKVVSDNLEISSYARIAGQTLTADVSICYMRMEDGRVFDLQGLCGKAPTAGERSPFSNSTPTTPRVPRELLPEEEETERENEEFTEPLDFQSYPTAVPRPSDSPIPSKPANTSPTATPVQPPDMGTPTPDTTPLQVAPSTPVTGTGYFRPYSNNDEVP